MRIKKVSQTTSTQAQVVDGYSTSVTDSYSCNYVNGMCGKILWTNSNPASSFAEQTVTLSGSDYDMLEVIYRYADNTNKQLSTGRIPSNSSGLVLSCIGENATNTPMRARTVTINNKTSISFGECYVGSTNTSTVNNTYNIPVYVIGYKTGVFD